MTKSIDYLQAFCMRGGEAYPRKETPTPRKRKQAAQRALICFGKINHNLGREF